MLEPTHNALVKADNKGRLHDKRRRVVPKTQLPHSHYYNSESGRWYKTCPRCSEMRGHLVWHPLDEFSHRKMPSGRVIAQSWCPDCRASRGE